ncbi:extracellular solute-binding protein [Fodinisporobacter ferrooxydans]|uniref:Extracellular solute-binding protein n=1 Tax=Fodinisporobacter ferrooxydans TaxID=2901836 RepID=A0ABY4CGX7_9BACL|nr:extracellular solute-binding protein [Alicyclobacillaceae bacterium MYW30-H2]
MKKLTKAIPVCVMTALSLSAVLSGCGTTSTAAGGQNSNSKTVTIWDISTGKQQELVKKVASEFNSKHPGIHADVQFFQNDPYKQKLQIAMGAHNPPDIFYGWGGGILKSYVDANDVYDLTSALNSDPKWKNKFLPSVLKGVTFDGKIYGIPINNVQPVVFNYNKEIFKKYNVTPPKTWDELLKVVQELKSHGISPIALAGKNKWPDLMYEEYLVDRIGGPKAFNAVIQKKPNAWSDPAFIKANTMIQELVKMGAFETGFTSVNFDTGESDALVYTGKAAMQLMGGWDFANILSTDPAYIKNKNFGWFSFPTVQNGKGDPNDIAGNLSNFYSVASASKNIKEDVTYLKDAVLNDTAVKGYIDIGDVPPVKGIEPQLQQNQYGDWLSFIYKLVDKAPNFQMSWDQALPPEEAQALLTNLDQLFLNQITPQQFSDNMNKYIK